MLFDDLRQNDIGRENIPHFHRTPSAQRLEPELEPDIVPRMQRAGTNYSAEQRALDGGANLITAKVEVEGKGIGTVVAMQISKGKPTEHIILFESGVREAVMLCKNPHADNPKGTKFWVLNAPEPAPENLGNFCEQCGAKFLFAEAKFCSTCGAARPE